MVPDALYTLASTLSAPSHLPTLHSHPVGHTCLSVNMGGCKYWDLNKSLLSGPRCPLLKYWVPTSKVVLFAGARWAPVAVHG